MRIHQPARRVHLRFENHAVLRFCNEQAFAIRAAKRLLNRLSVDPGPALLAESVEQQNLLGSANQGEAVRANMEKRAPKFADH